MQFFTEKKLYIAGIIILIFVIFTNLFPRGYVFGGGDTAQLINAKNSFWTLVYSWSGLASPFYFIFYLLDKSGINDTMQLSFYFGIFLIGSYVSFDIFSRLIFSKTAHLFRLLISLFYTLNLFTLFYFTGNWGFSHYLWLYVFIPILTGFFLKFLRTEKVIFGAWFAFFLFLASSGFGNPAFFLSLLIFFLSITFFLIIFRYFKFNKKLILKLAILAVFSLLVNTFWILPVIPTMQEGVSSLNSGNIIDLNSVLKKNSSPISMTWSLNHFSKDYFPYDFPYKSIKFLKKFFIIFSFIPIALVLFGTFFWKKIKNKDERKLFFALLGVLVVFTMLVARVRYPFETINNFIFHIWGMNTLRGVEKTSIFIPFLLSFLMLIIATNCEKYKKYKKYIVSILVLIILIPLPFFVGKIQQNISYRFPSGSNFQKYRLSFLIKIPKEYYDLQEIIDNDEEKSFVATLPATHHDGSGIANYPKWKFYGADVTRYLYKKTLITANESFFSGWNFTDEFNKDNGGNYSWVIKTIGMMNSRYLIFHKDAPKKSVGQSEFKIRILENNGVIKKITENDYFVLYSIPDEFFLPYISWQKENIPIEPNANSISINFEKIKENSKAADFQEINPKRYEVTVNGEAGDIILSEPFNTNWKAYSVDTKGKEKEILQHFLARGYANGWKISDKGNIRKIIIEFYPIRLLWRGMAITGAAILFLIIYLAYPAVMRLYKKLKPLKK